MNKGTKEKVNENAKEEEKHMAAMVKNFVYEVEMEESKKIREQPAVSKLFLEDCKKVAKKYQRK